MRHTIFRRFTIACIVVALAACFGTVAIAALSWSAVPLRSASVVASSIMVVTLALQFAFAAAQMLPEGRALIRLPYCGPDAWFFILSATLVPGAMWQVLSRLAAPPMNLLSFGFASPLMTGVLFIIGRQVQQRAYRAPDVAVD